MNCDSSVVTSRIANRLLTDNRVIGVIGIDNGRFSKMFAKQTTSFYMPTITYMYNDEEFMNEHYFPTLISLISTKEQEGQMIAQFLKEMDYGYMDIWYHKLSREIASHLSEQYLPKHGCGRTQEVFGSRSSNPGKNSEILKNYYNFSTERPAPVQVLLQNDLTESFKWMRNTTENLGFRNKIYVMGSSNGRIRYQKNYTDILERLNNSDDSVIYPLPALLNIEITKLNKDLAAPWIGQGRELDKLYRKSQLLGTGKCTAGQGCRTTTWSPHVVAGTKIIVRALQDTLKKRCLEFAKCQDSSQFTFTAVDFRRHVFETIVNESREIEVVLDENIAVNVSFKGRTMTSLTKIGVYRSKTEDFHILGEVSSDFFKVTNRSLLQEISHYEKRCSADCLPGKYRTYGTVAQLTKLPCCWQCKECPPNQFSNEINQNSCSKCNSNETSNENGTGCYDVEVIYIKTNSEAFIGGLTFIIVAIVMLIFVQWYWSRRTRKGLSSKLLALDICTLFWHR